jgi:hypothetical protein
MLRARLSQARLARRQSSAKCGGARLVARLLLFRA